MSQYLHVRCGPYGILLDLRHVVEVGDAGTVVDGTGWRAWRERNLRVTDLCAHLGLAAASRRQQVVVSDTDGFSIIDVEHVEGLREFAEACFLPLDGLGAALERLADAVVPGSQAGGCLLRLRHPVDAREGKP